MIDIEKKRQNDGLSKAHLDMPVDVQRCNAGLGGLAAAPMDNGFVQPFFDIRYHVFWIIKEEFLAAGEAQLKQPGFQHAHFRSQVLELAGN